LPARAPVHRHGRPTHARTCARRDPCSVARCERNATSAARRYTARACRRACHSTSPQKFRYSHCGQNPR